MCHSTACARAARTITGIHKHLYQLLGLHHHMDYATKTFVPYKRALSDVQRGRFGCTKTRVGDKAVEHSVTCVLSWFDTTLPSLWLLSDGHVYTCFTCPPHTILTADRKAKQQALTDASDQTGIPSTALQNHVFLSHRVCLAT